MQGLHEGSIIVDHNLPAQNNQGMNKAEIEGLIALFEPNLDPITRVSDNNVILIDYIPHDGEGKLTVTTTYSHEAWQSLSERDKAEVLEDMTPELTCKVG
jgi:hypothetical protein